MDFRWWSIFFSACLYACHGEKVAHENRQFAGWDCSQPAQVAKVGIRSRPCKEEAQASTQKNSTFVLVQKARYKRLTGFRCQQTVNAIATYCGHCSSQPTLVLFYSYAE